jgi:hypothetical protein
MLPQWRLFIRSSRRGRYTAEFRVVLDGGSEEVLKVVLSGRFKFVARWAPSERNHRW